MIKELYVDVNSLVENFRADNPDMADLDKHALWAIFTAGTVAQLHFQDENNTLLLAATMQIHRLAESMLADAGRKTPEEQLPVFRAVDKVIVSLLEAAVAKQLPEVAETES